MPHSPGVTETLARLAAETQWSDLPPQVTHQAKRSLMNFFAVALAGCRDATVETALQSLAGFSGGRQATLIGRRDRIDALGAAFLNAAAANVLDFCDTHVATAIHPTAPVAPALLALGELKRVGGRDLILALVLGHEVECRIGMAMSPGHYNKGWHITSTCGVFGAAAGSGKLMQLDAAQMVWALGTAATQSAGLCECLGTPAKSVSVGNAARNGLWSALLAANNFDGPPEPLGGVQGFYNAMGETPDLSRITGDLGSSWEILETVYKPYPCGFVIHPVLDCVLGWRRENPRAIVNKVVVTGNPLLAARTDRPNVSTGRESQVSVQHAVAAALVTGNAGPAQFTDACVQEPQVRALRRDVEVRRDERLQTTAVAVEIGTADGETHLLADSSPRAMTDRELERKLRDAAAAWNPSHDIAPLIEAVWELDKSEDISKLAVLAVPRG
jgi:2-methylcitrate dehydratase PrpD